MIVWASRRGRTPVVSVSRETGESCFMRASSHRADGRDLRQKIDGKTNVALLRQRWRDLAGKLEDADTRYAVIRQQQLADFLCGRRSVDEQGQSGLCADALQPFERGMNAFELNQRGIERRDFVAERLHEPCARAVRAHRRRGASTHRGDDVRGRK